MQAARMNFMEGHNGSNCVRFSGKTEAGRVIAIDVPRETIEQIAAMLKFTDTVGHAIWHIHNLASAPYPCDHCNRVEQPVV